MFTELWSAPSETVPLSATIVVCCPLSAVRTIWIPSSELPSRFVTCRTMPSAQVKSCPASTSSIAGRVAASCLCEQPQKARPDSRIISVILKTLTQPLTPNRSESCRARNANRVLQGGSVFIKGTRPSASWVVALGRSLRLDPIYVHVIGRGPKDPQNPPRPGIPPFVNLRMAVCKR